MADTKSLLFILCPCAHKNILLGILMFSQVQYVLSKFLPATLSLYLVIISNKVKSKWQMPRDSLQMTLPTCDKARL